MKVFSSKNSYHYTRNSESRHNSENCFDNFCKIMKILSFCKNNTIYSDFIVFNIIELLYYQNFNNMCLSLFHVCFFLLEIVFFFCFFKIVKCYILIIIRTFIFFYFTFILNIIYVKRIFNFIFV